MACLHTPEAKPCMLALTSADTHIHDRTRTQVKVLYQLERHKQGMNVNSAYQRALSVPAVWGQPHLPVSEQLPRCTKHIA